MGILWFGSSIHSAIMSKREPVSISRHDWAEYQLIKRLHMQAVGEDGIEAIRRAAEVVADNVEEHENVAHMAMDRMKAELLVISKAQLKKKTGIDIDEMMKDHEDEEEDEDEQPKDTQPEPGQDVQDKKPEQV